MSEDQILKQVDAEKVDWLKIAKVDVSRTKIVRLKFMSLH